ncbi:hypothetical protein SUGI_0182970 [Cryptomeria japonica]|nr:hypothetical protein SUGI_0182970 [Cryptomeria japonica]
MVAILVALSSSGVFRAKEERMVIYAHDSFSGPNATGIIVAGMGGVSSNPLGFGTVFVIDDPVTVGPDISSMYLGRAQGILVNSELKGTSFHLAFTIVFGSGKYNGSTLEIQGADPFKQKQREISVVGGTGMFRYARGYAVMETVSLLGLNACIRLTLNVRP